MSKYGQWTELARGSGNGHALSNVGVSKVALLVSNEAATVHYCTQREVERGASFGIAEAMTLEDERTLYYVIERERDGRWNYLIHADGETIPGDALCRNCHESGRLDPLFRAFRSAGCK